MSHIDDLKRSIDNVTVLDSLQPPDKASPGEEVLGEVSDEIKRIYILTNQKDQQVRDIIADSISARIDPTEDPETFKTLKKAKELRDLLRDLLWYTIYEEFNLWSLEDRNVGIRSGWVVVTFKSEPTELLDQLRGFL